MFPVSSPDGRISFVEDLVEVAAVHSAGPDASLCRVAEGNRFAVRRKFRGVNAIGIANALPFAALRIDKENAVRLFLFRFLAVHDAKFRAQEDAPNLLSRWSVLRTYSSTGS